jgi:hypothetical protein
VDNEGLGEKYMKKSILSLILVICISLSFSGCFRKSTYVSIETQAKNVCIDIM